MSLVSIRDIHFEIGGIHLLNAANMQIEQQERLCLIGRNGAGKSTLLKLIAKVASPDQGAIDYQQGLRIGLLPQEIPLGLEGSAFHIAASGLPKGADPAVDPELKQQVESILSRLHLNATTTFEEMSGGMKRRALLARALASDPDLLLLDEPTNHLDIDAITWLEGFLTRRKCTLFFVSHDRSFVDAVSTRIIELDRGILSSWPGGYQDYLRRKQEALIAEAKAQARFEKKLEEEEAWIRRGIKARRTRNEGRVRALQAMRELKKAELKRVGSAKITSSTASASGKRVIQAKNLSFSYPDTPIVKDLSTIIQRGDKVGIIGPNGVGKTTLLKLLLGEIPPEKGTIRHGARVENAHLSQMRDAIDDSLTLIENVIDKGDTVEVGGQRRHIIGYLKDFLFSPEAARAPARNLSGGERNRLLLAKLFTRPANVLVLDEPTNDLDTDTLELLENLMVEFKGTVLLVSHDRTFLNNVATSSLVFEGNGIVREYAGGYDDWLFQKQPQEAPPQKSVKKRREKPKDQGPKKLSYKEKLELESLPAQIESMESELEELRDAMAKPDFYQQESEAIKTAISRMEALEPELEVAYVRWEELESRVN